MTRNLAVIVSGLDTEWNKALKSLMLLPDRFRSHTTIYFLLVVPDDLVPETGKQITMRIFAGQSGRAEEYEAKDLQVRIVRC